MISFFGTSNEFYTTVTLLIICFFILIRSTTKKFISRLICPEIFLLRGAWKSSDFLQASRKPITSPSKISLLDISFPEDTWRKLNVHMTFRSGQDVFWTSYVRLVYVLCLRGWLNQCKMIFEKHFKDSHG